MRMNEPSAWPVDAQARREQFDSMLDTGKVIEVTHRASKWFSGPVAIETTTYDRFVAWEGEAQRRHLMHLDETQRLGQLLESCGIAISSAGGCFVCKAVDACGRDARPQRQVLTLSNYGLATAPAWLVHG